MVDLLRLAMPGLKSQKEYEQRKQVLDYAMHVPGSKFRAEIWMLRVAKAWPRLGQAPAQQQFRRSAHET